MHLVFVTSTALDSPRGGRAMLARVHRDCLRKLLGCGFRELLLDDRSNPLQKMRGFIDGATPAGIATTVAALDAHGAEALWLDGSNLGRLAKAVRLARPRVRIVTYCHNVEARFFLGALRRSPRPRAAGVLLANFIAERLAVRHSDDLVALSHRDSGGLERLYGRRATAIVPMALMDRLTNPSPEHVTVSNDAPLLFVGGSFYANRAGISWFTRSVAPRVRIRTLVVGQGMDVQRTELEAAPGVQVIGPVADLQPYYQAARVAIAPIFDGSGMKTKVAEALMFGKRVIGTHEAFSGYEAIAPAVGWVCSTAAEFTSAIEAAQAMEIKAFDPALRDLYERDHSERAAEQRLAAILGLQRPGQERVMLS